MEPLKEIAKFAIVGDYRDSRVWVEIERPDGKAHDAGSFPSMSEAVAYVERWARDRGLAVSPVLIISVTEKWEPPLSD